MASGPAFEPFAAVTTAALAVFRRQGANAGTARVPGWYFSIADAFSAGTDPGAAGRCRVWRGGVPHVATATDARVSGGGHPDRPARPWPGQRFGPDQIPGRIRRGLPDVLDRAWVQPGQAARD